MSVDLEKTADRDQFWSQNESSPTGTPLQSSSRQGSSYSDNEPAWPRSIRAYTSLLGCFFLMFNSWGLVNAYGTFLSYYQDALLSEYSILEFNLIGSTQCFMVLVSSFIVGRLLDADHSRILIIAGTCLVAIGMFLLSVVNGNGGVNQGNYPLTWLLQGLVTGLGMACFFVTSSQVASTWFVQRKGFAIGIVASGASISGLVYPIMLRFLITSRGFNFAVQMVSTLALITCIGSIFLARPNPSHVHRKPEKWLTIRTWIDTQAWHKPSFLWLTTSICFLFFGFYAVFFNLEEWASKQGVGLDANSPPSQRGLQTYYMLAIMNATSTIGRIGSAFLLTRFNALKVHVVVTLVSSLLCFLLWTMASTFEAALAFVIVFGAFSGAVIGLPPASMAAILHGDGQRLGQWTGMMYSVSSPFALAGPVTAGYIIKQYGYNYITVQCWSGGCMLASAACMAMAVYYDEAPKTMEEIEGVEDKEGLRVPERETARSRLGSLASTMTFWSKKEEA